MLRPASCHSQSSPRDETYSMLQVVAAHVVPFDLATFALIVAATRDARSMSGKRNWQERDAEHQRGQDGSEELHLCERKEVRW
jgi:hypothetical protein